MGLRTTTGKPGILLGLSTVLILAGCGGSAKNGVDSGTGAPLVGPVVSGYVHGGQQPIAGAKIELFAAGTTGYGANATALLTGAVTTGTDGSFSIVGHYTCPTPSAQIYIVSEGGDAGAGVNNSAVLMEALGDCSAISSSDPLNISEVSSVAAVYALGQFMTPGSVQVGTSGTNITGLKNAFATVKNLVDDTGAARATTPAGNGTISQKTINTLANIMAVCVNTAGTSGACSSLFSLATPPGGTAPADTLSAMLDIAMNPGRNVANLYSLVTAKASFQPSLTAIPNDLTLSIAYTGGGLNNGELLAVDAQGNIWVPNSIDPGTISEFSPTGEAISPTAGFTGGGLSYPESLAIDLSGNVWSANEGGASVSEHLPNGTALSGAGGFTVAGMEFPYAIAIDGANNIFTANGNNTVSKLSSTGSPLGLFRGAGMDVPYSVAIDASSNVWIANADEITGSNSISKLSNTGAALTVVPYTGGGLNAPVGVAVDANGNVWAANFKAASVSELSSTGVPMSGTGFVAPADTSAIAVDGKNTVWTANTDGSVSRFSSTGASLSPAKGYVAPGATAEVGIAVDGSGNVWTTDYYSNTLYEYVGAAGPAVVPQALAVKNHTIGQRP
jgi:streptogramin lyase